MQQENVSRFYYFFLPYFELFCTIVIFPYMYKLFIIALLHNVMLTVPRESGLPVIGYVSSGQCICKTFDFAIVEKHEIICTCTVITWSGVLNLD